MVRLARISNNMKCIEECSNAIDLIIFPEGKEKQCGNCIGSRSDHNVCKYMLEIGSGMCIYGICLLYKPIYCFSFIHLKSPVLINSIFSNYSKTRAGH